MRLTLPTVFILLTVMIDAMGASGIAITASSGAQVP